MFIDLSPQVFLRTFINETNLLKEIKNKNILTTITQNNVTNSSLFKIKCISDKVLFNQYI